ncbi:glycosyltransferase family 2 protein [Nocardioides sp. CFH 31398]|uniref:glycosyltransferase family 2 protein n=1 Tax=Nocardioides sp. CFH 31398 TaxID=2919579 RepID=UPI001F06603D|nr:glycosyltransferase family 2 protein [Nocardioides sp. CFH 31398]MCH1865994.1 glycosyltransferase family 2 protein [Nocardioides sp. CFH 31398]
MTSAPLDPAPELSVIVPAYNIADYLAECLDSLLAQTARSFEIIVVDDCSTDSTREIAMAYEAREHRITLVSHDHNQGLATTRNTGMEAARGVVIFFVDGDDYVEPDMLSTMSAFATPATPVVGCGVVVHSGGTSTTQFIGLPSARDLDAHELRTLLREAHTRRFYWYSQRFCFHRSFLDHEGLRFRPEIRLGEDSVFNCSALNTTTALRVVDQGLYHIRHRPNSLTSTKGQRGFADRISSQYVALREIYSSSPAENERLNDYFRYILAFQLPQAVNNALLIEGAGEAVLDELAAIRRSPWFRAASRDVAAVRSSTLKTRLLVAMVKRGHNRLLRTAYGLTDQGREILSRLGRSRRSFASRPAAR